MTTLMLDSDVSLTFNSDVYQRQNLTSDKGQIWSSVKFWPLFTVPWLTGGWQKVYIWLVKFWPLYNVPGRLVKSGSNCHNLTFIKRPGTFYKSQNITSDINLLLTPCTVKWRQVLPWSTAITDDRKVYFGENRLSEIYLISLSCTSFYFIVYLQCPFR